MAAKEATAIDEHVPGSEYKNVLFSENFSKSMTDDIWTNTTFYTFTNFVLQGEKDYTLQGASVLDLGCGGGLFSRWAAAQGASKVVGIDLSEEQIAVACKMDEDNDGHHSSGIEYYTKDVIDIKTPEYGEFDVIIAVHLLCYADNPEKLQRMLQAVSVCLKKGGRCIGVRECLDSALKGPVSMKMKEEIKNGPMLAYQIIPQSDEIVDSKDCDDFCACINEFRSSDGSIIKFKNYAVSESTMIKMFNDAGFEVNACGPMLTCSPEGKKMFPPNFIDKVTNNYGKLLWYFDITKN
ncbi:PREDICTED: uncharacterized protein LOC109590655 [Amphimedon queenslandica]|uniref:Methyltransferase type 11 domain-containing protein n=1 Tax=Amphimedon queenslandica TaxID=400682 RepID=A0A1X7VNG7_AMPQE|nr:PREDICTED: uncharacterized protein LOC109590655 [Amphimedon queenslandica]|eukprot:XP_019862110.1 PREDICTED: uncharacterized protein LOC109590655 [Amphimedon queenslandica]